MRIALLACTAMLFGCAVPTSHHNHFAAVATRWTEGTDVIIPRAKKYDFVSRVNGRRYRIMVSTPVDIDPAKSYPVMYVLDGNQYFGTAIEALTRQSTLRDVASAIVVGIGYPTDDPREVFRLRSFDMTVSPSDDPKLVGRFGGGELFDNVVEEEIKPYVEAYYPVDRARQIIWGQSLAGLTALRMLFRRPESFSTYILSSPSIWYNNQEVLKDEASFNARARLKELHLKILITSAGDEQYHGSDLQLIAADADKMVDNASQLAQRISTLDPENIVVTRTIFDGEIHNTVSPASLSRALRFSLPRD